MKLILATHNQNKIREFSQLLPGWDITGESPVCEETEPTFAGNALIKARALRAKLGDRVEAWILADDSGLCVDALDGEPGVRSARYAGEDGNTPANNALLLKNLTGVSNRTAHFTCAIAMISPAGEEHVVEGQCPGRILEAARGAGGFGYDPLFQPDGAACSFAELPPEAKNAISHRGRAIRKALEILA